MSRTKTVSFTRSLAVQPTARRAMLKLRKTCSACAAKSFLPTSAPSRSSAVCPAMKMMRVARTSTICE
jgi:hypothetical protein